MEVNSFHFNSIQFNAFQWNSIQFISTQRNGNCSLATLALAFQLSGFSLVQFGHFSIAAVAAKQLQLRAAFWIAAGGTERTRAAFSSAIGGCEGAKAGFSIAAGDSERAGAAFSRALHARACRAERHRGEAAPAAGGGRRLGEAVPPPCPSSPPDAPPRTRKRWSPGQGGHEMIGHEP